LHLVIRHVRFNNSSDVVGPGWFNWFRLVRHGLEEPEELEELDSYERLKILKRQQGWFGTATLKKIHIF